MAKHANNSHAAQKDTHSGSEDDVVVCAVEAGGFSGNEDENSSDNELINSGAHPATRKKKRGKRGVEAQSLQVEKDVGVSLGLRVGILMALMFQTSAFTLLRRYSQAVLHEKYTSGSVLLVAEFLKLIASVFAIGVASNRPLLPALTQNITSIAPMGVPALIYLAQNLLSFYSLRRVDAATFSLIFQLKLVTTAFFSRVILNKSFSWVQYRALALVVLGVVQITLCTMPSKSNQSNTSENWEFIKGSIAALFEVTLSGVCTVYMEMVFKNRNTGHTIWDRNFQLALASIPVYFGVSIFSGTGGHFFEGWSVLAVVLTILSAAGGLFVALCLKYTDSILKSFASTGAILLTTSLAHFLLNGPMNSFIMIASLVVVIAVLNYQL